MGGSRARGGCAVCFLVWVSFVVVSFFVRGIDCECDDLGTEPCIGRARSRRLGAGLEPFAFWRGLVETRMKVMECKVPEWDNRVHGSPSPSLSLKWILTGMHPGPSKGLATLSPSYQSCMAFHGFLSITL